MIFVEVALVKGLATAAPPLLSQDTDEAAARARAACADTAIFYSISNCQIGLRVVSFGNFLMKHSVEELDAEFPQLKRFLRLSPVPAFRRLLTQHREEGGGLGAGRCATSRATAGARIQRRGKCCAPC